jgi:hypothetical protein
MKTGIHLEGGKLTPLITRVVSILDKHLGAAIAGGREEVACAIVTELSKVGGVNGLTISNCSIGDRPAQ